MTTTPVGPEQLQQYLDAGQHRRLAEALADPALHLGDEPAATTLERRRWEAALAVRGEAPVIDLLVAARAHRAAATPHADTLAAQAARALRAAGFAELAATLAAVDDAGVDDGRPARGRRHLARAAALRATGDLAAAAAESEQARALLAGGDDQALAGLSAALDRWLVGDRAPARDGLRAVRDDDGAAADLRAAARAALDAIEADEGRPAAWRGGARLPADAVAAPGLLPALAALLDRPLPAAAIPTASHLRAALADAGLPTVRLVLDLDRLARALTVPGVVVLLEEERPRGLDVALVTGVEPTAQLVATWSAADGGALVRTAVERARRGALVGGGALLVVTGEPVATAAALTAAGLVDDPRLELVDRAHFDRDDPDVPHAHVAQLARRAIASAPEIPLGHRRLGEALIALGGLGRLDDDELLLERWVAETRERFPDAEWPLQLYAQALELWRRWPEALVAWTDAARVDPDDPRNHLGQVRAAREVGGLRGGRHGLRRALRLDPGTAEAWTWLAEEELAGGDDAAAQAAADLATALAPDAIEVLTLQATLAERRGERAAAAAFLTRACVDPGSRERGQTLRLWRHHLWAGQLDAMQALAAQRLVGRFPSAPAAWSILVDGALVRGDRDGALAAVDGGLQRAGASGELIDSAVDVLAALFPPTELAAELGRLEERLAGQSDPLVRIARGVGFAGHREVAAATLARLGERYPHDGNAPYSLAQVLSCPVAGRVGELPDPATAAQIGAALERALALAPQFPWVRLLLAWHQLAADPARALATLEPVADTVPVLCWDLMARALDAQGQAGPAAELRRRLPEVVGGLADHLGFLRRTGLVTAARELGTLALEHVEPGERGRLRLEHARTLALAGDGAAAVALVATVLGDEPDEPVVGTWLLKLAAQAGDAALVRARAAAVVASCRADSQRFTDPWLPLAIAAGVGDDVARAELAAGAPAHVGALRQRARAGRGTAAAAAAADLAALAAIAPGSATTIDQPEL